MSDTPQSVGEALAAADAAADETPADGDVAATDAQEGSTPAEGTDAADDATQAPETAAERKARLQQELADAQADIDAEQADRLAHASPDELCPTCGQLPPPADPPAGAREIWCPTCNQKLANLIPGS